MQEITQKTTQLASTAQASTNNRARDGFSVWDRASYGHTIHVQVLTVRVHPALFVRYVANLLECGNLTVV